MSLALIKKITDKSIKFRAAIISAKDKSNLPTQMSEFPRGCCGDTSILLGTYLQECGIEGIQYICGEMGNSSNNSWKSHAWLMKDDIIIDITRSQFADSGEEVTVTRETAWYDDWEQECKRFPNVTKVDDSLKGTYFIIIAEIK